MSRKRSPSTYLAVAALFAAGVVADLFAAFLTTMFGYETAWSNPVVFSVFSLLALPTVALSWVRMDTVDTVRQSAFGAGVLAGWVVVGLWMWFASPEIYCTSCST
jgi:hypothetical protein